MENDERMQRLAAERTALDELARQSSILSFEATGEPPSEYRVTFRGKGLTRGSVVGGEVETGEQHELEIRLGYSYPEYAPDLRILSPIFHPNVSSIGYVRPEEIGLEWQKDMLLDVICERLWDVIRGAYVKPEASMNFTASRWYEQQKQMALPVDPRALRDRGVVSGDHVVHYERGPARPEPAREGVLYIADDAPPPPPRPVPPPKQGKNDDVLYIGD